MHNQVLPGISGKKTENGGDTLAALGMTGRFPVRAGYDGKGALRQALRQAQGPTQGPAGDSRSGPGMTEGSGASRTKQSCPGHDGGTIYLLRPFCRETTSSKESSWNWKRVSRAARESARCWRTSRDRDMASSWASRAFRRASFSASSASVRV